MAGFLNRLFGRKAAPVDPVVAAEEKRQEFIEKANYFFDLPWDGRNRLRAASKETLHDIGEIRDAAIRDESEGGFYLRGRHVRPPVQWGYRIKYMAIVMEKLGYTAEEIKVRSDEIRSKYGTHFAPRRTPA